MNRLAIIDNEDSFTFNIVDMVRRQSGFDYTVFPSRYVTLQQLSTYSHFIISPGPGLPHEFPILYQILEQFKSTKSILGICLGLQAIYCFFGGKLFNLSEVRHGQVERVQVTAPSHLFNHIPKDFNAGLYHSWVADPDHLPASLRVTAISKSGYIMAVSHQEFNIHGVQFHPESFMCDHGHVMIQNFLNRKI